MTTLSAAQARRVAVAAQGFHEPAPRGPVTRAHLKRLIARLQVLQLDSVSVAVRAHYAPVFSRLGPYDRDVLDRAAWSHSARSPRLLIEYWAHEAALMAVEDWPLLRWRMRQYRHGRWGTDIVKKNARLAEEVLAAVAELGPCTAGQIEAYLESEPRGRKGPWWDRSETKWVAEALWSSGALTTATRVGFARHYELTERVLPPAVLNRQVDEADAVRELCLRAASALGVGTEADIREAARAFTGWGNDDLTFVIDPDKHDDGEKRFLGQTGNFDGDDILRIILDQDQTALYIASKIYRFFVRDDLSPAMAANLGALLCKHDYALKPFLRTLFLSQDFYSPASVATHIKSPTELLISTYRKL
uniref:DUF1800 family protein n=1 Tax=Mycolicibacterium poriferae TaxID=39694 RepID=UPI0024BA9798